MEFRHIKNMLFMAIFFGAISLTGTVGSFIYMDYFGQSKDTHKPGIIDQNGKPSTAEKSTDQEKSGEEKQEESIPGVKVFKVYEGPFTDTLPYVGTVTGESTTELKFETPGVITVFNYKGGDTVKKGDVIAETDHKDAELKVRYRNAKVQSAKTALLQAKQKMNTHKQLFNLGVISKAKMDEVTLEFKAAAQEFQAAQIELSSSKAELSKTYLICPKDGILKTKDVEIGETVSPNTKVASIVDIGTVFVEFGVIEKDLDRISSGLEVKASVDSSQHEFAGKIDAIDPYIDPNSRTLKITAKISNPENALIPGMFARISITVYQSQKALLIPRNCLIPPSEDGPKGYQVFIVDENNKAVTRDVAVEYDKNPDVAVIAKGLKAADKVILVESQAGLKNGAQVEILETQEGPIQ